MTGQESYVFLPFWRIKMIIANSDISKNCWQRMWPGCCCRQSYLLMDRGTDGQTLSQQMLCLTTLRCQKMTTNRCIYCTVWYV